MVDTLSMTRRLLAVFIGGFCGTIARYLLCQLIQGHFGTNFPYDIAFINITGAFLFAFITILANDTFLIGPTRRLFLTVGLLGACTTFSSLALGDILLVSKGAWIAALLYLCVSLVGGLLAALVGTWLGQDCLRLVGKQATQTMRYAPFQEVSKRK